MMSFMTKTNENCTHISKESDHNLQIIFNLLPYKDDEHFVALSVTAA